MRHGKKFNHLSRKSAHRKAMLSNMATSLIMNKRIFTTVAKAKALKKYVEPLITKSKDDTTHSRRVVFSYLKDKYSVTELFGDVASKVASRPGGYTRIIKTGTRLGDNADMCMIELVDYNEIYGAEAKPAKKKTRRRGGAKKATESKEETPKVEAKKDKAAEPKEEPKAEKKEAAPKAEKKEKKEDKKADDDSAEEKSE